MSDTSGPAADGFPDVRWGTLGGPLSTAATAFAATTLGSFVIRNLASTDRRLLERSRGRFTVLGPIGAPLLILATTGRKSGHAYRTPLLYLRDEDRLVVVGSNFGRQTHPGWTANLLAEPNATVTMAGRDIPVTATPITGDDKDRLYQQFVEVTRVYDTYRKRTDREIRMFGLAAR